MSKTKATGTTKLGRDSISKRLGIKLYSGQTAKAGTIIVRQRGTKYLPGKNVRKGKDDTLYAVKEGKVFAEVSTLALEYFSFRDLCFEYGNSGFGIIIPNIDLDQGIDRVETFMVKANSVLAGSKRALKLTAGLSARNGRLINGDRILREAEAALSKARDEVSGIVAFRVDPQKYRRYISTKAANDL